MSSLDRLTAAVSAVISVVSQLVAVYQSAPTPVAIDAISAQVEALTAQVQAVLPPAPIG